MKENLEGTKAHVAKHQMEFKVLNVLLKQTCKERKKMYSDAGW